MVRATRTIAGEYVKTGDSSRFCNKTIVDSENALREVKFSTEDIEVLESTGEKLMFTRTQRTVRVIRVKEIIESGDEICLN